tara:strand:+ start:600 stop:860 length:261 start_codon:yes stop_codon:yes gene_type:complete
MKTFVYKCLIASFVFLLVFYLSFGVVKRQISREISDLMSKENVGQIKNKIREELNTAIKKENYLNDEDAILINKFLNKIKKEISNK